MHIRDRLIEAGLWSRTDAADPEHELTAAWQLSERLRDMGWTMVLANRVSSRQHGEGAVLTRAEYRVDLYHSDIAIDRAGNAVTGYGATVALAICRAVLETLPYLERKKAKS
jgi:hypothetical protein